VVTPAYNAGRTLAETVASLQAQSLGDWEMLIVDDASQDDTRALMARLAAQDARIRPMVQERNAGPARARDRALLAARGRYIAFLDSDDLWLPEKLERQLEFMQRRNAAFSFTGFRRMSADGARLGRRIHVPERLTYGQLLGNTAIATSSAIIDRETTGPFRMTETYYDDFALWLEITRRGFAAAGLDLDLMRYRVVGGSVSRNKTRSARMVWRTYREVERLGLARASWSFVRYATNALLKYRAF
jgi:teichuronic acid biosynthesis glycosyltransferase TuaG